MCGDLPYAGVVYVGRKEQGVVLVPGHASDLVWQPLNHKWLCIHLVQVVQPQLLFISYRYSFVSAEPSVFLSLLWHNSGVVQASTNQIEDSDGLSS